VRQSWTAW
jgi:hypothetical protein